MAAARGFDGLLNPKAVRSGNTAGYLLIVGCKMPAECCFLEEGEPSGVTVQQSITCHTFGLTARSCLSFLFCLCKNEKETALDRLGFPASLKTNNYWKSRGHYKGLPKAGT